MLNLSNLIFSVVMGFLMSLSITLVLTFVRIETAESFFSVWLQAWLVAYPVAIVCILIYKPLASKFTETIIQKINSR